MVTPAPVGVAAPTAVMVTVSYCGRADGQPVAHDEAVHAADVDRGRAGAHTSRERGAA